MLDKPRALLILVPFVLAACSGSAATPTPAPTPAPTLPPTAPPTAPRTAPPTPSAAPTTAQSPVELLTSYAHPDLRDTCHEYHEVYDTELGSAECGPEDLLFQYTLFGSAAEMDAEFDDDVDGAQSPPVDGGTCAQGNSLTDYDFDGRVGRVNCREHTSSSSGAQYHVIEWTDSNLLVIGYISNRIDLHAWDDLIDFWLNQAGPYAP